jgi:hypothetical protein
MQIIADCAVIQAEITSAGKRHPVNVQIPFHPMNQRKNNVDLPFWSTIMTTAAEESSQGAVRTWPYLRACNIFFRTGHIGATAALFGGQVFNVGEERLLPWLYASILTGAALIIIESLSDRHWCGQGSGVMSLSKLLLLLLILWRWDYRVPILAAVIVLGSVGSHMPKKYRHYPVLFRK